MRHGLTLIELLIVISLLVVLTGATAYVFRIVLVNWSYFDTRTGLAIELDRGMEGVTRNLRMASAIQNLSSNEIRFTQGNNSSFIYYFYNSGKDYQLREAVLTGGINGTFVNNAGRIIMTQVAPPPASTMSVTGNVANITLALADRGEALNSRVIVRPRNL